MSEQVMGPAELLAAVDWDAAMAQPRYAGGHEEVLRVMFKDAEVIAEYTTGDYQGVVGFAYRMQNGQTVVLSDYYGSCSGCDAWEDSSEEDARKMIHDLATNAHAFATVDDAIAWLKGDAVSDASYYDMAEVAPHLAAALSTPGAP